VAWYHNIGGIRREKKWRKRKSIAKIKGNIKASASGGIMKRRMAASTWRVA